MKLSRLAASASLILATGIALTGCSGSSSDDAGTSDEAPVAEVPPEAQSAADRAAAMTAALTDSGFRLIGSVIATESEAAPWWVYVHFKGCPKAGGFRVVPAEQNGGVIGLRAADDAVITKEPDAATRTKHQLCKA